MVKIIPRWESFKSFFQLKFVIYLVTWFTLVPIVVKMLYNVPDTITLNSVTPPLTIVMSLPFSWETMWFSSLSFFIAYILYLIFIPKFVIKYNNYCDYKKFGHSPRNLVYEASSIVKIDKFITRMLEKKYIECIDKNIGKKVNPSVEEKQTVYYWEHKGKCYKFGMPIDNKESENEIFWEIFARFSGKYLIIRIIITLLLLVSLYLFATVLYHHILSGYQLIT